MLKTLVGPWLGQRPIGEIEPPELLRVLRQIESRGKHETAHRTKQRCGQVFRYAIATGRTRRDPSSDLRGALTPVRHQHRAAITDPARVGELLRAIDAFEGTFVVGCALKLAPLLFVRPGELRRAEWSEIDLGQAEWRIPAEKTKMREAHLVPLSTQAIAILAILKPLTGTSRYVFPSIRTRQQVMSENTINVALKRLGYDASQMCGHGFRACVDAAQRDGLGAGHHRATTGACAAEQGACGVQPRAAPRRAPEDDAGLGRLPGRPAPQGRGRPAASLRRSGRGPLNRKSPPKGRLAMRRW